MTHQKRFSKDRKAKGERRWEEAGAQGGILGAHNVICPYLRYSGLLPPNVRQNRRDSRFMSGKSKNAEGKRNCWAPLWWRPPILSHLPPNFCCSLRESIKFTHKEENIEQRDPPNAPSPLL